MPGVDNWLNDPLNVIQNIFDNSGYDHPEKVTEYFKEKLSSQISLSWIPSLNSTALHNLNPNSLVKLRCMVQDMYDPEFYMGVYETVDKTNGTVHLKSGRYQDVADCSPNCEVDFNGKQNKTMDRQTLYCVPIPGENTWVKMAHEENNQAKVIASGSTSAGRSKRHRDEDMMTEISTSNVNAMQSGVHVGTHNEDDISPRDETGDNNTETKRQRPDSETSTSCSSHIPNLNFPLSGETGPACIVKIYENLENKVMVNDVFQFIGVLSVDPSMAQFKATDSDGNTLLDPFSPGMEEENAHCPPPSLVPRLHVILANKLQHNNPLLPTALNSYEGTLVQERILTEVNTTRRNLVAILEQALFGDTLAAEYMICHLISFVYCRRDVVALGKFSLNLMGCPTKSEFPQLLNKLLQHTVTQSHFLPMTVNNLNTIQFAPKKDYTANRLLSGILQLSCGTHLVVDETVMEAGELNANGVKNLTALGIVVRWQKVEYDFNFHKQEFPCDIPVLILSEGKSLLQCDCMVPLIPCQSDASLAEKYSGIDQYLTPALLTKIRAYLDAVRLMEYTLPDSVQRVIEEDFVEMRRQDPAHMTIDDFHVLLILARLLSLSHGHKELKRDFWDKVKIMESERKIRLPQHSATLNI